MNEIGQNLLPNTGTLNEYAYSAFVSKAQGDNCNIMDFKANPTLTYNSCTVRKPILYSQVRNKEITISLDARTDQVAEFNAQTSRALFIEIFLLDENINNYTRRQWRDLTSTKNLSNDWKRFSYTITITDDMFTGSDGNGTTIINDNTRFSVSVFNHSIYSMQAKQLKLELSTQATDWSPAPEDIHTPATITRRGGNLVKDIENAEVVLNFSSVVYDTQEHAPKVQSVSYDGQLLIEKQDYVAVITPYVNVGNYNIFINGINNYTGIKLVSWKIEKAKSSIKIEPTEITIPGDIGSIATVDIIYEGDGNITISNNYHVNAKIINYDLIFSKNSWEQIAEVCANGQVPDTWKIGDKKIITLTGEDAGDYYIQIIGKNHDILDPSDVNYNNLKYNNGINKAALTLQFFELLDTDRVMHTIDDNSCSWKDSDMRLNTMPLILDEMPDIIRKNIRFVTKQAPKNASDSTLVNTTDQLFLLDPYEVFEDPNAGIKAGELYAYYMLANVALKRKKNDSSNYTRQWLRHLVEGPNYTGSFYYIYNGSRSLALATNNNSIAPAFCV